MTGTFPAHNKGRLHRSHSAGRQLLLECSVKQFSASALSSAHQECASGMPDVLQSVCKATSLTSNCVGDGFNEREMEIK